MMNAKILILLTNKKMEPDFMVLKNIKKIYWWKDMEPVYALRWVDLTIGDWDFTAIMWPSWCGKSTLMNIVGLLDVPT